MYKISILSRHPSHRILRRELPKLPVRSLIRLGSITELKDGYNRVEINSVESIKISSNKRIMKEHFNKARCCTARWITAKDVPELMKTITSESSGIKFPIVAKHVLGSRGTGNSLLRDKDELTRWAYNRKFENYIFERFVNYFLEYRLHVTEDGCFYACRKALIRDTRDSERWRRHKDNSVWFLESNENFHKPNSWNDIVIHCVNALKAIGADVLSFDVKVQTRLDKDGNEREYQDFILIECNSASSMQSPSNQEISMCASKYLEIIPKLINKKIK